MDKYNEGDSIIKDIKKGYGYILTTDNTRDLIVENTKVTTNDKLPEFILRKN